MDGMHVHWVDRAMATIDVFNDDAWTAALRLEGSGRYEIDGTQLRLGNGDRFTI